MRILVTNDDGIDAPGIAVLAASLAGSGHEIVVAAPAFDASGSSAAVGPRPVLSPPVFTPVDLPGLDGIRCYRVDALPALIVHEVCRGAIGPVPELIASGINRGRNVGGSVVHSGTVGAAVTAAQLGRRALAVSIQARSTHVHFETAGAIAAEMLPLLLEMRPASVLNCNVPNLALADLAGIRRARLSRTGPILPEVNRVRDEGSTELRESRMAIPSIRDPADPADRDRHEKAEGPDSGAAPGARRSTSTLFYDPTDDELSLQGYATVTPLLPVSEDHDPSIVAALGDPLAVLARRLGIGRD